jgi:hypothetical protein
VTPFDPAPLVALAAAQGRAALADALARCTAGTPDGRAYVRFAEAPVHETVRLDRRGGDVLVDVAADGHVVGVEWLGRL